MNPLPSLFCFANSVVFFQFRRVLYYFFVLCDFTCFRCRALVRYLSTAPESMAFRRPVDTTVFTDYHKFVDDPCDLRTIDRRLEASE